MVLEDGRVARKRAARRARVSVVGVIGELLITAGVFVLLFIGWQLGINDLVVGNQQQAEAVDQSREWNQGEQVAPTATASPQVARPDPGEPVVALAPANAVRFANLIVPRFGSEYTRPVAEGIGISDVLSDSIGHYPGTQMPGAVGNMALAGHRTGWGQPFGDIANLQVGDSIYLETQDGWYRYVFRSLEYVMPSEVGVLDPVPQLASSAATDRILTLTSCNPKTTAAERIVMYSVFDTWYPRADGAPTEISAATSAVG